MIGTVINCRIVIEKGSDRSNIGDLHTLDLRFKVDTYRDLEKALAAALAAAKALPNGE
jgi:hypothetical protein